MSAASVTAAATPSAASKRSPFCSGYAGTTTTTTNTTKPKVETQGVSASASAMLRSPEPDDLLQRGVEERAEFG